MTAKLTSPLEKFRKDVIHENSPRQRFVVLREDGSEELKKDILGSYKNPKVRLTAKPYVKFEEEEGVGSGPAREFLLCAMKIVEKRLEKHGKPVMFFEGEDDHKIPIHDHTLRCTGAFLAIGRIIGHSVLHCGPYLYGVSQAILHYWKFAAAGDVDDLSIESLPINLNVLKRIIPDFEIRQLITQVINLTLTKNILFPVAVKKMYC